MSSSSRRIGLLAAIAVVLGNIVGVMVFITPSEIARHLPWDNWFLAVWVVGGVLALMGALCMAELGAMLPRAGGDYVFIREAYGDSLAFLSGWTSVVITFPGSIAAMAVGLCSFQGAELFGPVVNDAAFQVSRGDWTFEVTRAQLMAMGVVLLLSVINHFGAQLAGWMQTVLVALPVILLVVAGIAAAFVDPSARPCVVPTGRDGSPWLGLFPALIPVFFAYTGWNVVTYVGGEVRSPERNIPRSIIIGTLLALGLYVLINWMFLRALPAGAMSGVSFVPAVAVTRLFGDWAGVWVGSLVALAVLGSLNSTTLAGARITSAMANDGVALACLKKISPRYRTPFLALWGQTILAMSLTLSGRFEQLIAYVVVVMLISSCLAVGSVMVLRFKYPAADRPYRVWGYPVTPLVYIAFSLGVVGFMLVDETMRQEALSGMGITLLGLPVFWWMRSRHFKKTGTPENTSSAINQGAIRGDRVMRLTVLFYALLFTQCGDLAADASADCLSENVCYSRDIVPLVGRDCASCHSRGQDGVRLRGEEGDYSEIIRYVVPYDSDGSMFLDWASGYRRHPESWPPTSGAYRCTETWIDEGAKLDCQEEPVDDTAPTD